MVGRITAATLILLAGCKGSPLLNPFPSGKALSYSQYHSLERGMRAQAILRAFGTPAHTLEQDGKVRGLTYPCENSAGRVMQLRMVFDAQERLQQWALKSPDGSEPPAQGAKATS
ncbi:MAG: hypothetical protein ACYTEZ_05575 [Planctomycetota bacterium]|jgi:hypothetical protein